MYGLYGPKHHIVEISGDVTDPDNQTTSEYRATQLLICEKLSLAIIISGMIIISGIIIIKIIISGIS